VTFCAEPIASREHAARNEEGRSVVAQAGIHSFVGAAAGFDAETLQAGAAAAEGAGGNDLYDVLSIHIGIWLWNEYGADLTIDQLRDAILAHREEYERIFREVYEPAGSEWRVVIECEGASCR